jgi:hypothetical protein
MPDGTDRNSQHNTAPFIDALINTIAELSRSYGQVITLLDKLDNNTSRLEGLLQSLRDGFGALEERSRKMSAQHYDESHLAYEFVHELRPRLETLKEQLNDLRNKRVDVSKENLDALTDTINLALERFCPASASHQCTHIHAAINKALDDKLPLLKILTSKWLGIGVITLILGLLTAILVLVGVRNLSIDQRGLRFETQAVQNLSDMEAKLNAKLNAIQTRLRAVEHVDSATD